MTYRRTFAKDVLARFLSELQKQFKFSKISGMLYLLESDGIVISLFILQ